MGYIIWANNFKPISTVFCSAVFAIYSLSSLADCNDNNGNIFCSGSTSTPYFVPYYKDVNVLADGIWYYSGRTNSMLGINAYGESAKIQFNANMIWNNAQVATTSASSAWAAIGIGWDASAVWGRNAEITMSRGSTLTVNLGESGISNNRSSIVGIGSNNTGGILGGNATLTNDGLVQINDYRLLNDGGQVLGVYTRASNSDTYIRNSGTVRIIGDSGSGAVYFGLASYSNNSSTESKRKSLIINDGEISVIDRASNDSNAYGVAFYLGGTGIDSTLENRGRITVIDTGLNSNANGVYYSDFSNAGGLEIYNSKQASIKVEAPNSGKARAIYLSGAGYLNLENDGDITGGIFTSSSATENASDKILNSGGISGDIFTYSGDDYFDFLDGFVSGVVKAGDGDDVAIWQGGKINEFWGDAGSDRLTITNRAQVAQSNRLDGGDDHSISDGMIDTLSFIGIDTVVVADNLVNWENIEIIKGNIIISGEKLTASNEDGYGVFVGNNGALQAGLDFILDGNLSIEEYGRFSMNQDTNYSNNYVINGKVINSGRIVFNKRTDTDAMIINGDYIGSGGVLELNTELNGDKSLSDLFVINGLASGSTRLVVNNFYGEGYETDTGIKVIQTNSSTDNAFFLREGYVSAGQYEYKLGMINENNQDNWYLSASFTPENIDEPLFSPNPGAALDIQKANNNLFNSRLEDREGASRKLYLENDNGNFWLRTYGYHTEFSSLNKQLKTKGQGLATQAGIGILQLGEDKQTTLGVMASYGQYSGDSRSKISDRKSSSSTNGYSLGAYGTWYEDPSEKNGFYMDSWVLWNHFDNTLKSADGYKLNFKSKGITASVELGSHYLLTAEENLQWWMQPQLQVQYQGVKANDFRDDMGVKIKSGSHNILTRIGAKSSIETMSINENIHYRPYIEINWLHNTNPQSVKVNDESYRAFGEKNLAELKLGFEGNFSDQGQVWINSAYQAGSHGNRTLYGNLGIKYNF